MGTDATVAFQDSLPKSGQRNFASWKRSVVTAYSVPNAVIGNSNFGTSAHGYLAALNRLRHQHVMALNLAKISALVHHFSLSSYVGNDGIDYQFADKTGHESPILATIGVAYSLCQF